MAIQVVIGVSIGGLIVLLYVLLIANGIPLTFWHWGACFGFVWVVTFISLRLNLRGVIWAMGMVTVLGCLTATAIMLRQ